MEILSGRKLAKKIAHVCRSKGRRDIVVAFWGIGMKDSLFPDGLKNVRIILDTALCGTSKAALKEFGFPTPPEYLKVFKGRLHTKIYIGSDGAVVTSANASANALGRDLQGGSLEEVGVWIDGGIDGPAYTELNKIFERLWEGSRNGNQDDLDRAPERPMKAMTETGEQAEGISFLEMVKQNPGRFNDVRFIFGDRDVKDEDFKQVALAKDVRVKGGTCSNDVDFVLYYETEVEYDRMQDFKSLAFYWHERGNWKVDFYHELTFVDNQLKPDHRGLFAKCSLNTFKKTYGVSSKFSMPKSLTNDLHRLNDVAGDEALGRRWAEYNAEELQAKLI